MRGVFCFKYFWRCGRFLNVVSFGGAVIKQTKAIQSDKSKRSLAAPLALGQVRKRVSIER